MACFPDFVFTPLLEFLLPPSRHVFVYFCARFAYYLPVFVDSPPA
ncbi:MAG TPA: hypothetical protein VJX29_12170 [Candidatus Acidoferrales bacterium]|nr:hypothetical protein [Candidatus Acidoferrales bacterium]